MIDDDIESVDVPLMQNPLSSHHMDALKQAIDPLEQCDDHGISLYNITRTFVHACL